MAGRARRVPERLGAFAGEAEVEDALELGEEGLEEEAEYARPRKVLRRGGAGWARPAVTADDVSCLLAGAPALVDQLLEECSIRSVTLVARDAVNLSLAAGGKVELSPVWAALAQRLRKKAAAKAAAGSLAAEADAPGSPHEASGSSAATGTRPPAKRRCSGRKPAKQPPKPPTDLEIVQAAVAADPARKNEVKKADAQHLFQLSNKNLQGVKTYRGRWGATYILEMDARSAAHKKHGDEAQMQARKLAAAARCEQARKTHEERQAELRRRREEELAFRLAENRLPANAASEDGLPEYWHLLAWLNYGHRNLTEVLDPMIKAYRDSLARQQRQAALDEGLAQEGMSFFKRDWRYRAFLAHGIVEEVESVLVVARRQQEARRQELFRVLDLEERLDAACLSCLYTATGPQFREWVATGEGDIDGQVAELGAQLKRQTQLLGLLDLNGLMHRRSAGRCKLFIQGGGPHGGADDVVKGLLRSLSKQHSRCRQLQDRLSAERLEPNLWHPAAKAFISEGGSLEEVVQLMKAAAYRAGTGIEPPAGPSYWQPVVHKGKTDDFAFFH